MLSNSSQKRPLFFLALWFVVLYMLLFEGPPQSPEQQAQLMQLLTLNWAGISAWKVVLFNLLGVWPMVMAIFLWPERQRLAYWPFGCLSFVLGMYALLPYFIFRQPMARLKDDALSRWLTQRSTLVVLMSVSVLLLAYGFSFGDIGVFAQELKNEHFVFAMTLDALLFQGVAWTLLFEDRKRRPFQHGLLPTLCFYLLPLVGTLLYLYMRPRAQAAMLES